MLGFFCFCFYRWRNRNTDWLSNICWYSLSRTIKSLFRLLMKLLAHFQPLEHTSWIKLMCLYKRTKCAQDSHLLPFFFFSSDMVLRLLVSENYGADINWVLWGQQNENFRKRTKKQAVIWIELEYSVFGRKSGQITANYYDKILIFFFLEKWT